MPLPKIFAPTGYLEFVNDGAGNVAEIHIRYTWKDDIKRSVIALVLLGMGLCLIAPNLNPRRHFRSEYAGVLLIFAGATILFRIIHARLTHGGNDVVVVANDQGLNLFLYEQISIVPWSDVGNLEIWKTVSQGELLVATLRNEAIYLSQLRQNHPLSPDKKNAPPFATVAFGHAYDIYKLLDPLRSLRDRAKAHETQPIDVSASPSPDESEFTNSAPMNTPLRKPSVASASRLVSVAVFCASIAFVVYMFVSNGGFPALHSAFRAYAGHNDDDDSVAPNTNLKSQADGGDAYAQFLLGSRYEFGRDGYPRDAQEAVRYYTLAADQGNYKAEFNLGLIYQYGKYGVAKDEEKAVQLYTFAKAQGDSSAASGLAIMYMNGEGGLPKDEAAAMELFKGAADRNDSVAQYYLGRAYLIGNSSITKNDTEAVRLFRLSADQGLSDSEVALAYLYYNGTHGVSQSYEEAARLYKLASDHGNAQAMYGLASMYNSGLGGLPKDGVQGRQLLQRAASLGYAHARELLERYDAKKPAKP